VSTARKSGDGGSSAAGAACSTVCLIVGTDVEENELLFRELQQQDYAVRVRKGDGVETREFTRERMQPQGRLKGVLAHPFS
jgi:3-deoxy-D-manno-octulosonic-acid transferase